MADHLEMLRWIDTQQALMTQRLTTWANINSGSENLLGLSRMADELEIAAEVLGGIFERVALLPQTLVNAQGVSVERELGQLLRITKRTHAPRRIVLGIHYDTVYGVEHPFQQTTLLDDDTLQGPGVADAKGGLVVLLTALEAFERCPFASQLGWTVLLNPDEEIASPGSTVYFQQAAATHDLGLLYEPALPDGNLIGARKGSGNFAIVIRGRAAHAGRDYASGRNALYAAATAMCALNALNDRFEGLTVNVGKVDGGGPVNIVPDLAVVRLNIRVLNQEQMQFAQQQLATIVDTVNQSDGLTAELHGRFFAPPKPMTPALQYLLEQLQNCGRSLEMKLGWQTSGGVCDGNRLAAAGLPVVDTLGVVGGNIHSDQEYAQLGSLSQRAQLSAQLLYKLASGELQFPH